MYKLVEFRRKKKLTRCKNYHNLQLQIQFKSILYKRNLKLTMIKPQNHAETQNCWSSQPHSEASKLDDKN